MAKKSAPKVTYVSLSADESLHPKYEAAVKRLKSKLGERYPMYIGGKEIWSNKGEFEHRSPFDTSIIVGRFQIGTPEHAKMAVDAAREGFELWSKTPWEDRVRKLETTAKLIDDRKFDIAAAITYEVGKNRTEALAECWEAVDAINYYAHLMRKEDGYTAKMGPGGPGENCRLVCKPIGVWPVISPFNFPFMLASGMALGALLAGNSVILKPTSSAPLTGLKLYEVFRDGGVPPGAVNYVTGPGGNFEEEFISNPNVAGIAFTGSNLVKRFRTAMLVRNASPSEQAASTLRAALSTVSMASRRKTGQIWEATSPRWRVASFWNMRPSSAMA
jgi:1-pyrroline-5-carboxylate dehydrogenase